MKRKYLIIAGLLFMFAHAVFAQEPETTSIFKEVFAGPSDSASRDAWLAAMKKWRNDTREKINYSDATYLCPELLWTKTTFINAQVMACDRYLYDPVSGKYTVDRYLNDLKKRYGGLDGVLIWPTYPNIGVDNRNQFDLTNDMPGGKKAIRQMIIDFKKRGVRVFFPIMIWDHGTRDAGMAMPIVLVKEMKELGADGLNGDTMLGVTEDFQNAADSLDYPLGFQPEVYLKDLKMIEWNTMSWGYWWKSWTNSDYEYRPGVSVYKWLEPRHLVNITNRWAINKTDDLQSAFFNGVGYNPWENIWGVWNQIPERYAEAIRRIATIYRKFPDIWTSSQWSPYIPTMQPGIFATAFPGLDKTIYTLVNRDSMDRKGQQLKLPYKEEVVYYNIWNGTKLNPRREGDHIYLSFPMERNGFGAILAVKSYAWNKKDENFLKKMHAMSEKPLKDISDEWKPLQQKIVEIKKTAPTAKKPDGMILIPAVKNFVFESKGVMIEGDALPTAVGVQYPWEMHPSRAQKHKMSIPSFYIDKYPVTNKQFKNFMDDTHYHPEDDHNFLKDWKNGTYPEGWDNKPVTWVSIEDAKAYATWAGKRLPHEWEWQYAAQGKQYRLYPWGNKKDDEKVPVFDSSRVMPPPADVDAFPAGASSFRVMDMVGNVWQWTDEYEDIHTRFAILKGGSRYRPVTSGWYFPQAHELNKYGKYLLMSPSLDRSGMIGFRCVADR